MCYALCIGCIPISLLLLPAANPLELQNIQCAGWRRANKSVSTDQAVTELLDKHLIAHLQATHCYEGKFMHSFRRGRAIGDTAAGVSDVDIMGKLLPKTLVVLKQKYQPPGYHNSGVKCIRSSGQPVAKGCMPSSGPQPSPS